MFQPIKKVFVGVVALAALALGGSAIVLIARHSDADEMIAALGERSQAATRRGLNADDVAALQKSLGGWPAAAAPPSWRGEQAVEESESE